MTSTSLFIGPHSVQAAYSGGGGYDGGISSAMPQSVAAVSYSFTRLANVGLTIPISSLMASNTPASGETLLFAGLPSNTSNAGASLSNDLASVFYTANRTVGNSDTFSYTIKNQFGTTTAGTVTILLVPAGGIARTITLSGGYPIISFAGGGSLSYDIQRATSLAGPWSTLLMVNAPSNGLFSYSDTNSPGVDAVFYRLAGN